MIKYIITVVLVWPMLMSAQANIDENFEEWDGVSFTYTDMQGEVGSNQLDFSTLSITNDQENIFIRFNFENVEINLQSNNSIRLFIDTDNNPSTGTEINGVGAEIEFRFGSRFGVAYLPSVTASIDQNDIGLTSLPTVTGDDFEIAIKRDLSIDGEQVPWSDRINVVLTNGSGGDQMPAQGEFITYGLDDALVSTLAPYSIDKIQGDHLRVLSLNTLFDRTFEAQNEPSARRIISRLNPDIIAFQEARSTSADFAAEMMDDWIPLPDNNNWKSEKIQGSDIIVCSRESILRSMPLDGNGAFYLTFGSYEIFLINAHLPCCENEDGRQEEVDNIMSFVRESKNGLTDIPLAEDTPIIILGDMNFVGFSQQRATLLDGNIIDESTYGVDFVPDWDNTNFEMSDLTTTDAPFALTWRNDFSEFWPGRLDYIIYSGSVLRQENGFALDTRSMTSQHLTDYGLSRFDSNNISDHFACVADFDLDFVTSVDNPVIEDHPNIQIIQNNQILELSVNLNRQENMSIVIVDALGRAHLIKKEELHSGINTIQLNISNLKAATYYLQIKSSTFNESIPFIIPK